MNVHLVVGPALHDALVEAGVHPSPPGAPSIISAPGGHTSWQSLSEDLTELYRVTRAAAVAGASVVFVVSGDALLGRTGPLDAMSAMGVVSASRTLALELRKGGAVVNCVATAADSPPDVTARWALRLLQAEPGDPTGTVVHLGGMQIGKALS